MLSRVAEAFFWIGRYLERAEGTARILEVVIQQTTGQVGEPANVAAARLLTVMGLPAQAETGLADAVATNSMGLITALFHDSGYVRRQRETSAALGPCGADQPSARVNV